MGSKHIVIESRKPAETMPLWAILERRLIDTMNLSVDLVVEKYIKPNGYILWPTSEDYKSIDGLDDAYESFHSWPLFYLLGGADKFLALSHKEYNAITEQFTHYDCGHGHPMVVDEYEEGYDWMHQGEGYLFFYFLNLADPGNEKNRERSIRYANYYAGLDPEVPNYDPVNKVFRCCYMGSKGPAYRNFDNQPWGYADWKQWYGLPYADVEGVVTVEDIKDDEKARRMGETMTKRLTHSDTIINLFATTMVMNAYLHTGDDRYKSMVLDYIGAWRQRTERNGGIVPDNAGPSGLPGECMNGKWYGGYYGWTWPHGFYFIADVLTVAAENETLLTGDRSRMNWLRGQVNKLVEKGVEKEGTLYVPQKKGDPGAIQEYGNNPDNILTMPGKVTGREDFHRWLEIDGWYEFMPLLCAQLAHMWAMTLSREDQELIHKTRNYRTRPWENLEEFYSKYQGGQDPGWLNYLEGEFRDYPEKILMHNLSQVYGRLKLMREDKQDPKTYSDSYLQMRNPITVEGLVQLTMGGPMPIYNGGLLVVSVRYFDVGRQRPGLPEDVAALISSITEEGIELTLVNLHPMEDHSLLIQSGAFTEHRFTTVTYISDTSDQVCCDVNDSYVQVNLGPGTILDLKLGLDRYSRQPSYQLPWNSSC
jgi:hypothetical protein